MGGSSVKGTLHQWDPPLQRNLSDGETSLMGERRLWETSVTGKPMGDLHLGGTLL